jgi:hypothetical protein
VFERLLKRLDEEELAGLNHVIACPWCSADFLIDLALCKGPALLLREGVPSASQAVPTALPAIAALESRSWEEWVNEAEAGNLDRSDLLRLVLRASREVQLSSPKKAFGIALAFFEQRAWLSSMPEGQDLRLEGMELIVNGSRLSKVVGWDYGEKVEEVCLEGASLGARARYRRAKGLMLWQQGELEEADQHLVQAAMDFYGAGELGEEGATLTLLGLLLQEKTPGERETGCILTAGLSGMPRGERPWLEARGLLALAAAWARSGGRTSVSRSYLEYAESLYGSLIESDPHLLWARGKALAAATDMSLAAAQLAEARDRMIAGRHFGEAVLVTLDLTYTKVQEGAVEWAAADVERIAKGFAEEPLVAIASTLMGWWDENVGIPLEQRWADVERALFMELRADGPGLEPLPFV